MRLLISLLFITFCVVLLISEEHASYSPKSNIFLVKNHILKPKPVKILSRDHQDDAPTTSDCEPNVGPLKIPNISVIYPTDPDSLPEPIENYEFDWAGFHHENDEKDFDEEYQRLEKRNKYHPSGDFEKGYLKHVHLYPPSCACQTKYRLFDLGHNTFPQYLLNAVCINRQKDSRNCWLGSKCKEIPYVVRVLTQRNTENETIQDDEMAHLLPHDLKYSWKFKNVKVSAACQCAL